MRRAAWLLFLTLLLAARGASAGVLPAIVEQAKQDACALVTVDQPPTTLQLALGLGLFGALLADDSHLAGQGERHLPAWTLHFEPGGRTATPNVVAAALLVEGFGLGDRRGTIGGLTLIEGNLILDFAFNASKSAFGRARPNRSNAGEWRAGGDSFPSSHAAHAFLIASVLDATIDRPAWRWAIYSLASGVALARIKEGVHYPTDVVAGGLLGWWIGHRLSASHGLIDRPGPSKVQIAWAPVRGGGAIIASLSLP